MKKRTKLLWSVLTASTLLLTSVGSCFPTVYATETSLTPAETLYTNTAMLYQYGDYPALTQTGSAKTASGKSHILSASLEQVVYDGMKKNNASISVASFQLSANELKTAVENVLNTSPELFYVNKSYSYSTAEDGTVHNLIPKYNSSGEELQKQKEYYYTQVAQIVNLVQPSWTDLEKIIFVHDYLAQNYSYDTNYSIYDTYNFFVQQKGVCQAYTLTFLAIMKELGIETSVAVSDSMAHIWNLVRLNGNWYHIDNTWDDPVNDRFGLASHNNLLLSDTAIATCRGGSSDYHTSWSAPYTCTDTTYDSYFWENSISPFQYSDGVWYYTYYNSDTNSSVLASYNFQSAKSTDLITIGNWYTAENNHYTKCYSGLNVYNKKIYYNSASAIYSYEPNTHTSTTVLTPSLSGSIYGMRINGQSLYFADSNTPSNTGTIYTHTLEAPLETPKPIPTYIPDDVLTSDAPVTPTPTPGGIPGGFEIGGPSQTPADTSQPAASSKPSATVTLGDVNMDNEITLADAQLALKAALKIDTLSTDAMTAADVDGNHTIELADAQLILKYALKIITTFEPTVILYSCDSMT